ncbi:hypothetical protein ACIPVK_13580 [Paeniglutamicibacter sp. MACA_103]|uniref:hypothetical protein n=1 Tax=Paeniglutamicibacter sp. MACA_103 TaxID=3377337 RepID=UPI00389420DC
MSKTIPANTVTTITLQGPGPHGISMLHKTRSRATETRGSEFPAITAVGLKALVAVHRFELQASNNPTCFTKTDNNNPHRQSDAGSITVKV